MKLFAARVEVSQTARTRASEIPFVAKAAMEERKRRERGGVGRFIQ